MLRKPLFPGKNDTDQLDMITDLLGTPSENTISEIQGDETRKYLRNMCIKSPVPFAEKFPNSDPQAIKLLQKLLVFDPRHRPTAEEVLADTYFKDLEINEEEPSLPAISSDEFEFENPLLTMDKIRELMYHEILEHHPQTLQDHLSQQEDFNFTYPRSALKLRAIPSTGPKPNQSMTAFEPTAAIDGRLLDFDDKVRAQAVSVVSDLEFQRNEDAMEAAPSKLQHGGGESLTSTEEANEAQCGCTVQTILFFDLDVDASVAIKEESKRNEYAMEIAPAKLQYSVKSVASCVDTR